jgi:hypothetical protein
MDVWLLCVFMLSGRGLCDELVTRPEESYLLQEGTTSMVMAPDSFMIFTGSVRNILNKPSCTWVIKEFGLSSDWYQDSCQFTAVHTVILTQACQINWYKLSLTNQSQTQRKSPITHPRHACNALPARISSWSVACIKLCFPKPWPVRFNKPPCWKLSENPSFPKLISLVPIKRRGATQPLSFYFPPGNV